MQIPAHRAAWAQVLETELVIGGGATGVGVARDAALRGFDTVLVERGDLAEGTTGRYHGLLHSGGRCAVCRWQITAGSDHASVHPVELLFRAYGLEL